MSGRLEGKVAVVTGGASGMGRATVERFLAEGARVVIGDVNEAAGAETLGALAAGERLVFAASDVAEEADIEALVALARHRFGRIDIMFNNAGIGGAFGPIGETLVAEWDYSFAVLVRGVFLGMKHAGNAMKAQGQGGVILSTASIAGLGGGAGPHAYSAAKAAVANLTRAVAGELAHHRIRVNAIAPGAIRTPLFHAGRAEKMEAIAAEKTPWHRLGEGADIASAALYLASEDGEYVTGQILVVDGGALALGPDFWGHGPDALFLRKAGVNHGSTGAATDVRELEE